MNQTQLHTLEAAIQSDYGNIAGMVVLKNGETRYENYFNGYAAGNAAHVFSVTKSVFSALIGIAIEQGCLKSVRQKVLDFFPDYALPAGEQTAQNVTLEHLLTMTAPYKYETEPYERFFASPNPIKDALDLLGGDKPIGTFNYSAVGGTHILSGVLTKATGRPVLDFATENLFAPLDICVPRSIRLRSQQEHMAVMNDKNTSGWVADPQGRNTASWGLVLPPADMAKFGQLYLDRGARGGRQIVPAGWVEASTAEHSRFGVLAYGYLWWIVDEGERCFAALGVGGNAIYVNGKTGLVVAIASLFVPNAKDRIRFIKSYVEPCFS
jgi:CubicO group peptidase (beta-lactamase class C family)